MERLTDAPIEKDKQFLGLIKKGIKPTNEKHVDYLDNIKNELERAKHTKTPINNDYINQQIEEIKKNNKNHIKKSKIDGNMLCLITDSGEAKWYDNIKAGNFKITRSDNKTAIIQLPKSKLLNMKVGDQEKPFWIAYEKELVALPNTPIIDSAIAYQNIEEIISNRKNFEAQTINAWSGLVWQIGLVFIILLGIAFIAMPMFVGEDLVTMLTKAKANATKTTTQPTTSQTLDTNKTIQVLQGQYIPMRGENYATKA